MRLRIATLAATLAFTTAPIVLAQSDSFSDKDKTFLKNSTEDNLGEVKMAELVLKSSKNPEVKQFAQKMVTDHRSLIRGAKPVAMKAGVTPPTSTSAASEAEYLKLKVLIGETFDKSYVKTMVSDHHDDMEKVKAEHDSTDNAAMKSLTTHAGDVIAGHTKMIDALAGKMGLQ